MAEHGAPGRIITFYSYKGGTGRSLAMANVAWILAHNGYRVAAVDWDLEAPGLHRYFRPFLLDKHLVSSDGLMDFVSEYTAAAMRDPGQEEPVAPDWYVRHADLTRYAVSLDWSFPGRGRLDLIPAGRQVATYATLVNSFNWQNFYDRLGGFRFLEAAKDHLRDGYDFVLIDSRTGVSDTAGICTVQMPDDLVVCFTFNNQSIEGAAGVAQSAHEQRLKQPGARPLRIFPVPMRVDQGEQDKLKLRRELARWRFKDLVGHVAAADRHAYWGDVEVPYMPYLAYEEVLSTFKEDAADPKVALSAILRVARRVSGLPSLSYQFLAPPFRRDEVLAAFAETPVPGPRRAPAAAPSAAAAAAESPAAPRPVESASAEFTRRAEAAYLGLTAAEQKAARQLLTRLTAVPSLEHASEPTRRRAPLEEAAAAGGPAGGLVEKLQSAGLLLVDPDRRTVEPAHDAIVRDWSRMAQWIAEDREFLLWRESLDHRRREWQSHRDDDALLRGSTLAEAEDRLRRRGEDFNEGERAFIGASAERRRRLFRSQLTAAALLAGVVLAAAAAAWWAQGRSGQQERAAKLLGAARAATDPLEAALLCAETAGLPEPTGWRAVVAAVAAQPIPRAELIGHRGAVNSAEFSADGRYLATAGADGTTRVWQADTGTLLSTLPLPSVSNDGVLHASFSPDGSSVNALAGSRRVSWSWQARKESAGSAAGPGRAGSLLAASSADRTTLLGADGKAYVIWGGGDLSRPQAPGHVSPWLAGPPGSVALSPSGAYVVTGGTDGRVSVLAAGGSLRARFCAHRGPVAAVAVSPDGKLVATGGQDRAVRVWDPGTLAPGLTLLPAVFVLERGCDPDVLPSRSFEQDAGIRALAVHPAGPWVAAATDGGYANIHALAAADAGETAVSTLRGQRGPLLSVAFSSDGRLATASADGTVRVWPRPRPASAPQVQPAQADEASAMTWDGIAERFRQSTTACLSPDQRQQLIGEPLTEARAAYEACERRYGRTPRADDRAAGRAAAR